MIYGKGCTGTREGLGTPHVKVIPHQGDHTGESREPRAKMTTVVTMVAVVMMTTTTTTTTIVLLIFVLSICSSCTWNIAEGQSRWTSSWQHGFLGESRKASKC